VCAGKGYGTNPGEKYQEISLEKVYA